MDDLTNCWFDLGIALSFPMAVLHNIKEEYNYSKQRAYAVIEGWMQREGTSATMGRLAVVLQMIGKSNIAHKLIGMPFLFVFVLYFLRWLCFESFRTR